MFPMVPYHALPKLHAAIQADCPPAYRSTAEAWTGFQMRLAEVVSVMDETADLTIGVESVSEDSGPYLRFSAPDRHLVRCEAAAYVTSGDRGPQFAGIDRPARRMQRDVARRRA